MQKIKLIGLFLLLLLIYSPFASAAITNYTVSTQIPLGKYLTISGMLNPGVAGVPCNYEVFDDQNVLVTRLTEQTSSAGGLISTAYYRIQDRDEPKFYLGFDYNVVTNCDGNIASAVFTVADPETIAYGVNTTTKYLGLAGNQETLQAVLLIFIIVVALGSILYASYQKARGR